MRKEKSNHSLALVGVVLLALAVPPHPETREARASVATPLREALASLGPVRGRVAHAGRVWLLGGETHVLLSLEFDDHGEAEVKSRRLLEGLDPAARVSGLAFLPEGSLVTIEEMRTLLAIDPATGAATVIGDLPWPAFGIWSWGNSLVVNPAVQSSGTEAPLLERKAGHSWKSFSVWKARKGSGRLQTLVVNQVGCSFASLGSRLCWRLIAPQDLKRLDRRGTLRAVVLSDSGGVPASVDLGPAGLARIGIRDAALLAQGGVVVLRVHGARLSWEDFRAQGFRSSELAWYGSDGALLGTRALPRRAQQILHVSRGGAATVLLKGGTLTVLEKP